MFEAVDTLELRFNPYKRTSAMLTEEQRIDDMMRVVNLVSSATKTDFPIRTTLILCMDRGFPVVRNRAIIELARRHPACVAVDLAGPYQPEGPTLSGLTCTATPRKRDSVPQHIWQNPIQRTFTPSYFLT